VSAREVMAELFGKKTGCCRGQGGSMHMFSAKNNFLGGYAFIGEGVPVGLGAAFQSKWVPGCAAGCPMPRLAAAGCCWRRVCRQRCCAAWRCRRCCSRRRSATSAEAVPATS
jgi:hypothetical protein